MKSKRLNVAIRITGSQVRSEQEVISDSIPGKRAKVTKYAIAIEYMCDTIGREA